MNWKKYLRSLELNQQWDCAIKFMQGVIHANPDDMDAYIYMNFLLMNTLVEVDRASYDVTNNDYYKSLCKKYFDESYAKFSNNAEYLFCTGITAVMSEWYFGITAEDYEEMLTKALKLAPNNLLYNVHLDKNLPGQHIKTLEHANLIIHDDPMLKKELDTRGALGAYLRDCQLGWAKDILGIYRHSPADA